MVRRGRWSRWGSGRRSSRSRSSYGDWGGFAPYVSVAERRAEAARTLAAMRKAGKTVSPIVIEGRTIARTFWGAAWCDNLERYSDFANRIPRGRTYVRNGSVIDLQIGAGRVDALVSGSAIYRVTVEVMPVPAAPWKAICRQSAGGIDSLVELLQARFSKAVMAHLCRQGTGLFPTPAEIAFSCSCPDWASMCKHVAAVLYGVGARLDHQPELLFRLRQVDEQELISHAGEGVPLAAGGLAAGVPAAGRVLEGEDLGAVFGVDLAAPVAPVAPAAQGSPTAAGARASARKRGAPEAAVAPTAPVAQVAPAVQGSPTAAGARASARKRGAPEAAVAPTAPVAQVAPAAQGSTTAAGPRASARKRGAPEAAVAGVLAGERGTARVPAQPPAAAPAGPSPKRGRRAQTTPPDGGKPATGEAMRKRGRRTGTPASVTGERATDPKTAGAGREPGGRRDLAGLSGAKSGPSGAKSGPRAAKTSKVNVGRAAQAGPPAAKTSTSKAGRVTLTGPDARGAGAKPSTGRSKAAAAAGETSARRRLRR